MKQLRKVLFALIIGIIAGLITNLNGFANIKIFDLMGTVYVLLLKSVAPVLVFVMVLSSISNMKSKDIKQALSIRNIVILYMVTSLIASAIAVIASFIFRIGIPGLTNNSVATVGDTSQDLVTSLILNVVKNPISALIDGNYLAILFWSILLGIVLRGLKADTAKKVISELADTISGAVQQIIKFAYLGVFGLIYTAVATNGIGIFKDYGKLILLLVGVMLFITFVTNPIVFWICTKQNPYPLLFKCLRTSGINALSTRSSASNIPINMELCKELGLDENVYSISIPLGATINMDAAAITITVMALSAAFSLGIDVNLGTAFVMCFVSTLAAAGAAGVAGGSLMLIPLACSLLGVPVEAAWFTVGVGNQIGFVQDSFETAENSSADVYFTACAEIMANNRLKNKRREK